MAFISHNMLDLSGMINSGIVSVVHGLYSTITMHTMSSRSGIIHDNSGST